MEKNIYKELFDVVYQWGRVGIKTDENCETFKKLIEEIENTAIYDYKRHGETQPTNMLNKLKSILPGQMPTLQFNEVDHSFGLGFNQALTEIEALLPDMLALIREEIETKLIIHSKKIIENNTYPKYGKRYLGKEKEDTRYEGLLLDVSDMGDDILNILK